MADISTELANIMSAIYGEEVRGSIHDAIQKMNTELDSAISGTLNGFGFRGNYNGSLDGLYTENDRGIWLLRPNGSFTGYPDGYSKSRGGILFVYSNDYSGNSYCRQELRYYSVNNDSENSKVWTRTYFTEGVGFSAFSEWTLDAPLTFKGNYSNGSSINALSSEDDRGIYKLLGSYTYSGLPDDYDQSIAGYLIVYAMGSNAIQELRYFSGSGGNENIIWRRNYSGSWNTWEKNIDSLLTKEGIAADAKAVGDLVVPLKNIVDEHTFIEKRLLSSDDDLNDIILMGLYFVTRSEEDGWKPANWPINGGGSLLVFRRTTTSETTPLLRTIQVVLANDIYMRYGLSDYNWSEWILFKNSTEIEKVSFVERRYLTGSDDTDNALDGGIYRITRSGSNWMPNNWPSSSSGGTLLVFRWGAYGDNRTLGTFQFALTGNVTYIRWGGSEGISWSNWIEYKDYNTIYNTLSASIGVEYSDTNAYHAYNYVFKEGNFYTCLVDKEENEPWVAGKFRETTIANELSQIRAASEGTKFNKELDYFQFPITWINARTSDGDIVIETASVVNRRILSDYISTETIDAIRIVDPFFNVGLATYDSNKQWVSNLTLSTLPQGENIVFLPKKVSYVRLCFVYLPDEVPNKFDIADVVRYHAFGIKFFMTNRYDQNANKFITKIPFGIGNFLSNGDETYNYTLYRLRTGFIGTSGFSSIRIKNDDEYQYTLNVRYLDSNYAVKATESFVNQSVANINKNYPYFCIQAYNTENPNTTPLSAIHAIQHIELLSDISEASSIIALNDEKTMRTKLQQISTNYAAVANMPKQPFTMIHFSDLHSNAVALTRIVEFADYYSDYITDIMHSGDIVGSIKHTFTFGDVPGAERILNGIGNHDTWNSDGSTYEYWHYLSEADTYNRYYAPYVSDWGENLHITAGKCYYYKDYPDNNVRFIMLDCMHETQEQVTWFTQTLNSARTNGYHVLISDHVKMGNSEALTYLDSGFDNPVYPRSSTPNSPFPNVAGTAFIDVVDDYISGGGIVVAWLCGHMHCDTLATYHNVLNIAVTTAGDVAYSRTYDNRVLNDKSYDAFNVVGVDTVRGHLYLVRVGLDYTATMRKIDTLCWNYLTHTLVHTS